MVAGARITYSTPGAKGVFLVTSHKGFQRAVEFCMQSTTHTQSRPHEHGSKRRREGRERGEERKGERKRKKKRF